MISFRPLNGLIRLIPLINGLYKWPVHRGDPKHLRPSWDDPPRPVRRTEDSKEVGHQCCRAVGCLAVSGIFFFRSWENGCPN